MQLFGSAVIQSLYILSGISTLPQLNSLFVTLKESFRQDVCLREDIVNALRQATQNQMGVYVSTWKYCPLIDSSLEKQLDCIVENE